MRCYPITKVKLSYLREEQSLRINLDFEKIQGVAELNQFIKTRQFKPVKSDH
jgi:hypothetical protein